MTEPSAFRATCHCERVSIGLDARIDVLWTCNCSFCKLRGGHWIYLDAGRVRFERGEALLRTYTFNSYSSRNMFCRVCGIHIICRPRVFPDRYSVRAECIEGLSPADYAGRIEQFDGARWEENAEALRARDARLPTGGADGAFGHV